MNELRRDTKLPDFLMCPRFIVRYHLSGTAVCMYMLLYERARMSQKSDKWTDQDGNVFELYTLSELMAGLGRSRRCVQNTLNELSEAGLIRKEFLFPGRVNKIYILLPDTEVQASAPGDGNIMHRDNADSCTEGAHVSTPGCGNNLHPSYNNKDINTELYNSYISNLIGYGKYSNVFLTADEYAELQISIPNLLGLIDKMSAYLASSGKTYRNYAAALNSWAAREPKSYKDKKYVCNPDESL